MSSEAPCPRFVCLSKAHRSYTLYLRLGDCVDYVGIDVSVGVFFSALGVPYKVTVDLG